MAGPIRSLSGMIEDVQTRIDDTRRLTNRLRDANRKLTGSDASAPTPITAARPPEPSTSEPSALMVMLTISLSTLEQALDELRAEIGYMEGFSETSDAPKTEQKYVASTLGR